MGETTNLSTMIEDLKKTWGMTQNNLTNWLETAVSTISGWKDYKWTQVSKGHIRLVAIYCGESIEDADGLKKAFKRLAENEGYNGDHIFNVRNGNYDDIFLEKEIKAVHKLILDEYLKRENLTGASKSIKEFIEKKYPSFLKKEQIQNNDTNKLSEATEADTPEVEDSPEQSEATEADTSEVEGSPEQPEADTSEVEDSPEQPEATEADTPMTEDETKSLGETELLKTQGEYEEATELGEHIEHLIRAAEDGDMEANLELGLAYKDGKGVIKNFSKAVEYFFKAGKLGSGDAVYELKECYQNRVGVEKKQAGRKGMWLRMVLIDNHYKCKKYMVDISIDLKLPSKERLKYVKKWHEFLPETDEERRLKELIEIWGGIEY